MLNTNLPLMKRNIYQPAIGCSCGLHTWPTLLQSVCKYTILTQRVSATVDDLKKYCSTVLVQVFEKKYQNYGKMPHRSK